jgi:hypothetical protein
MDALIYQTKEEKPGKTEEEAEKSEEHITSFI